jgi:hypothetical protein
VVDGGHALLVAELPEDFQELVVGAFGVVVGASQLGQGAELTLESGSWS